MFNFLHPPPHLIPISTYSYYSHLHNLCTLILFLHLFSLVFPLYSSNLIQAAAFCLEELVLMDPHNAIHNAHLGDVYYTLGTMHCTALHCTAFSSTSVLSIIVYVCVCMYVCTHVCMYACMYVCMHAWFRCVYAHVRIFLPFVTSSVIHFLIFCFTDLPILFIYWLS